MNILIREYKSDGSLLLMKKEIKMDRTLNTDEFMIK
jgi:hypothetical protein